MNKNIKNEKKNSPNYIRRRELEKLSPEEWRQRLEKVPDVQRAATARIIWWDFFSQRNVKSRWNQLDNLLQGPDIEGPLIAEGLMLCGFTEHMATTRVGKS